MVQQSGVHEITYTNEGHVPVADVAASLLANEQLLKDAAQLLQQLYPGLTVESLRIDFRAATTSSPLKELLAYSLIVVFQDDLKEEVPALIEQITGVAVPENMDTLITVLVMVVAIYGISAAVQRFGKKRPGEDDAALPPSIEGNYNTVIQIGGDLLGVEPKQLEEAMDKQFKPRGKLAALAKRAIQFIRPAKAEDGAGVTGATAELTPDAIRDAPSITDLALEEAAESQEPHTDVTVIIHATDIDHMKQGWAGHIPGILEKRTRMQLYPTVDATALFTRRAVRADVIVVSRKNEADEFYPYLILVLKVNDL